MSILAIWAFVAVLGAGAAADRGADFIAARELYDGADYNGALVILNGLTTDGPTSGDVVPIQQYRALCYLALGDAVEARRALEAIVAAAPFYRSAVVDISPRLESSFAEVRQRLLPDVVQRTYAAGKAAYERHDYRASADEFNNVLRLLDDPDLSAAARGRFADLRVVAAGFVDLSVRDATPPSTTSRPAASAEQPLVRKVDEVYTAENPAVVPPVAIKQTLPAFSAIGQSLPVHISSGRAIQGQVEVTIAEDGKVINAKMRVSTKTPYDVLVVAAAGRWQYKPASIEGTPVKYLKVVGINVVGTP